MGVGDSAVLSIALLMRVVTIVVCVLSTETPMTRLPEGTFLLNVIGTQLIAFEAIGKFGFASPMLLA